MAGLGGAGFGPVFGMAKNRVAQLNPKSHLLRCVRSVNYPFKHANLALVQKKHPMHALKPPTDGIGQVGEVEPEGYGASRNLSLVLWR